MSKHWIKHPKDKVESLLNDEAKAMDMLTVLEQTVKQLKAKSAFKLALLNQLNEDINTDNH